MEDAKETQPESLDWRKEYATIKARLDRHERWIKQLAKKAGISLNSDF